MAKKSTFDILIIIARPAAGKSELIYYIKNISAAERERRFHIGEFEEIDDFPLLWAWFEEDRILSDMGKPRLHTTADGYFLYTYLWDVLIRRISLEYEKRLRKNQRYHERMTAVIEFARGSEHGGFNRAFQHLSLGILKSAAVLYINVSYSESVRKNRRRFNPDAPDSILEHSLPDDKMEKLYKDSDWESFSSRDPEFLDVQGIKVPYAVMENEDDVTTKQGEALGVRLEETMSRLWGIYIKNMADK
jgi:hypothetical protein